MNNESKLNRRTLIKSLGLSALGGGILSYQNCSKVGFSNTTSDSTNKKKEKDDCTTDLSIFECPAKPPTAQAGVLKLDGYDVKSVTGSTDTMALALNPNAKHYKAPYFDHVLNMQKDIHLLTIDVGLDPANGIYYSVAGNDYSDLIFLTDIFVFNQATGDLLHSRRIGSSERIGSTMIVLDEALVTAQTKLTVVSHCLSNGYYSQVVDLAQPSLDYSTAVATFVPGAAFGGSSLLRPYISVDATGGQGNISSLHSPHFFSVSNTEVKVTLGNHASKHGAFAENHYVAGGALFDQNGNLLSLMAEQTYAQAANHELIFNNLDLSGRGVTHMRAVVLDTLNGILQSFHKLS
jgi:hypothetical protein